MDGSTEVHFRDSGLFECAAYELSAMLGLFQVPPAVRRRIGPVEGSLQIVAPTWFSESDRVTGGLADPSSQRWNKQLATMNVFDALIANPDRNRRNLLYDETWRLWITDHSRAFRVSTRLDEAPLQAIERSFWVSLGGLESGAISDAVSAYLSDGELSALLERRDRYPRVTHLAVDIRTQCWVGAVKSYRVKGGRQALCIHPLGNKLKPSIGPVSITLTSKHTGWIFPLTFKWEYASGVRK